MVFENIMRKTREIFLNRVNWLPEMGMGRNEVHFSVWIVSALFCAVYCLNDGSYFPEDDTPKCEILFGKQKIDVEFYRTRLRPVLYLMMR